jgi:tetratricopeptide (TPR) repeat protein
VAEQNDQGGKGQPHNPANPAEGEPASPPPLPHRRVPTLAGAAAAGVPGSLPRPMVPRAPIQVPAPAAAAPAAVTPSPPAAASPPAGPLAPKPPLPRRATLGGGPPPGPITFGTPPAAPAPKATSSSGTFAAVSAPAVTLSAVAPAGTPAPPVAQAAPVVRAAPVKRRQVSLVELEEETAKVAPEDELRRRAERLHAERDDVGAARAWVELGLYLERVTDDRAAARAAYESARALSRTLEPALTRIRRLLEGRAELGILLTILDDELAVAEGDGLKADLWAERARTCDALGRMAEARAGHAEALRLAPGHPAALRGLESVLRRELAAAPDKELAAQLAAHLERLAEAYAPAADRPDGDPRVAAWLHVERAGVLDRRLDQPELARMALERAVAFEPAPGPVRDALTRHLVRHDETALLVESLSVEAEHERDDDRAARLYYTAARLVIDKLGSRTAAADDPSRVSSPGLADAIQLLQRAAARAPHHTPNSYRTLAELIRLLELSGDLEHAPEVRQQRLGLLLAAGATGEAVTFEHVRLSEIFDGLGRADQAAYHAEQALLLDPDDASTRERLDRALQRLGRHEERVRTWVGEANARRPVAVRVAALLRAADIAERHLRRRDEAVAHLRAGWTIDPGNASIFEALSAILAPPAREAEADVRGVRARLELYAQAAQAAVDPARKVGLLEKLAGIWEDELGQPARALEEIDKILAIEPQRRTAILALGRNAQRAADHKQLARALQAEADLTQDPVDERRLLLRAAEVHAELLGDRDRALALVERALAIDEADPEALRARYRINEKASRFEEARRTLLRLIGAEPDEGRRFALWLSVARLDEQRLRRPHDASSAYAQAALVRPRSPLPALEIARILRAENEPRKLCEALLGLAATAPDEVEYARYLFQAAEVQEMMLGDDAAALKCLLQADALPLSARDQGPLEAMERIHVRARAGAELASLYTRWIERKPHAARDHGLRVALAGVLAEGSREEAVSLLDGLVTVVPGHVPALRLLEQLHRTMGAPAPLAAVLRAEADVFTSSRARAGALWELCALEEQLGAAATLDALGRLCAESPRDAAALDAIVRVASKLVSGVNVPLPAAIATRARLVPAIKARKELCRDPIARAIYQIEEAMLVEAQGPDDAATVRAALAGHQAALSLWPESLLAARALARIAERVGDRPSLIQSQLVLARLAERPRQRAQHLVRAAALYEEAKAPTEALPLYEEALRTDADCVPAASALSRMLAADVPRLVDRLGDALEEAVSRDQIVLLGTELGRAVLRHREARGAGLAGVPDGPDAGVGVTALRHVLAVTPEDVGALLLMARLLLAQRVWADARDTLLRAIAVAPAADSESRVVAHFLLSDLYETRLGDLAQAQASLQAILALDDKNRNALERLVAVAGARGDRALGIQTLGRLAEISLDPAGRVEVDLRLADACRDAGDAAGRVRALADAVATLPNDARPGTALARLYRTDTSDGAAGYAAALQQVLDLAAARRLPIDPRWLTTMGMLEVTVLMRAREGVAHLTQAAQLPGAAPDVRVALGRGLEAAGRNAEAVQVFRDVLAAEGETLARVADLPLALTSFEAALAKEGRVEERLALEEVRACFGDVKAERLSRLRARRLSEGAPYALSLAGAELLRLLVPEARSPLLEVAAAIQPIAAKILRFELANIGVASRDRLSARDGHPTRVLADRLARALGIEAFDVYLTATWQGAARVYPGDPPAIVASTTFAELPEPEQLYALARLLTRAALGPTWLDELPVDAVDGLLLASLRAVDPGFAGGELTAPRESMAQSFLPAVQKAIGRRQRKQIEELLPTILSNYDARAITIGVRRSEYRAAYVLAGDLVAALDYLRRFDRDIGRSAEDARVLLSHPVTNELLRYAMSAESVTERRKVGAIWA